jgi:hypothetical protein
VVWFVVLLATIGVVVVLVVVWVVSVIEVLIVEGARFGVSLVISDVLTVLWEDVEVLSVCGRPGGISDADVWLLLVVAAAGPGSSSSGVAGSRSCGGWTRSGCVSCVGIAVWVSSTGGVVWVLSVCGRPGGISEVDVWLLLVVAAVGPGSSSSNGVAGSRSCGGWMRSGCVSCVGIAVWVSSAGSVVWVLGIESS